MITNILEQDPPTEDIAAISRIRLENCSGQKAEPSNDDWMGNNPDSLVGLKSIEEQTRILRAFFPELGSPNQDLRAYIASGKVTLPGRSTDWFASFHWSKVGYTFPEALSRVFTLLNRLHGDGFANSLELSYLREGQEKIRSLEELGHVQRADIIVFPAQFGRLYQFISVGDARAIMKSGEFGLGIFEVALMLLVHPERLKHLISRRIDCAGDRYFPAAEKKGAYTPSVGFKFGNMKMDYVNICHYHQHCGSASGFSGELIVAPGTFGLPEGMRRHAFFFTLLFGYAFLGHHDEPVLPRLRTIRKYRRYFQTSRIVRYGEIIPIGIRSGSSVIGIWKIYAAEREIGMVASGGTGEMVGPKVKALVAGYPTQIVVSERGDTCFGRWEKLVHAAGMLESDGLSGVVGYEA